MGGFQAVLDLALGRRHRRLAGDQAVGHGRQGVDIGIASRKLRRRILLRRGVTGIELAFQLAAGGAQRQRAVAGQPGTAVDGQKNVVRADAAVDQPRFVELRHPFHDRLEQGACLGGGQVAGAQTQIVGQRHALGVFLHRIDGVVLLPHIQNLGKTGGRGQPVQVVIEILEIHAAGLEENLPALLGHQGAVGGAAVAQCDGEILLDEHKALFGVLHAAVAQAVAVGALVIPHRIAPRQLGAQRQRALRVMVFKALSAGGAIPMVPLHRLQAVGAKKLV